MKMAFRLLGLSALALSALGAGFACSATGASGTGIGGSGSGTGGSLPTTTTVIVNVVGVGEVSAVGKSATETCARDAKSMVTGNCQTGWPKGDPPLLKAKSTVAGWQFQSWVDPMSGMTVSTKDQYQVAEGSALSINALFLNAGASSSSSGCGGANCGCVNNVCPDTVAMGLSSVANMIERGSDLYYLSGTVDKVAKSGGMPTTIVNGSVGSFTVDDTSVFWVDGTGASLFKANLDGTGTTKLVGLDSGQYAHPLAVDDTNVYVAMLVNHGMGNCTAVMSMPKAAPGMLTEVANGCDFLDQAKPYAIGINSTDVFWGTSLMPKGGNLYSAPKSGQGVAGKALATSASSPVTRIAVDDTTIFYLQNGLRMIDAKSPGMPLQVGTTMMTITGFAIDASSIFVGGGMGVSSVDRQAQKETLLANNPASTLAVDATDVYFATGNVGAVQILKIAK